jgi:hypothetical protein
MSIISNTAVQTGNSAIIQAYPWSSGLPLANNKVGVVENLLNGGNHSPELAKLALVSDACFTSYIYNLTIE